MSENVNQGNIYKKEGADMGVAYRIDSQPTNKTGLIIQEDDGKSTPYKDYERRFSAAIPASLTFLAGDLIRYKEIEYAFIKTILGSKGSGGDLTSCDNQSLLNALQFCCKYNLTPSGDEGTVFIMKFGSEAKAILGYKGYIEMIYRDPTIESCHGDLVYEGDEVDCTAGTFHSLEHKVSFKNAGPIIGAYAFVKYKADDEGRNKIFGKTVRLFEIQEAKTASKNQHIWKNYYSMMAQAVAYRKLGNALLSIPPEDQNHE